MCFAFWSFRAFQTPNSPQKQVDSLDCRYVSSAIEQRMSSAMVSKLMYLSNRVPGMLCERGQRTTSREATRRRRRAEGTSHGGATTTRSSATTRATPRASLISSRVTTAQMTTTWTTIRRMNRPSPRTLMGTGTRSPTSTTSVTLATRTRSPTRIRERRL